MIKEHLELICSHKDSPRNKIKSIVQDNFSLYSKDNIKYFIDNSHNLSTFIPYFLEIINYKNNPLELALFLLKQQELCQSQQFLYNPNILGKLQETLCKEEFLQFYPELFINFIPDNKKQYNKSVLYINFLCESFNKYFIQPSLLYPHHEYFLITIDNLTCKKEHKNLTNILLKKYLSFSTFPNQYKTLLGQFVKQERIKKYSFEELYKEDRDITLQFINILEHMPYLYKENNTVFSEIEKIKLEDGIPKSHVKNSSVKKRI